MVQSPLICLPLYLVWIVEIINLISQVILHRVRISSCSEKLVGSFDSVLWKPPTPAPSTAAPTIPPTEMAPLGDLLDSSTTDVLSKDGSKDIILVSNDKAQCQAKKKIILDLKNTILGHRLLTLTSTALLSNLMDRSLEIYWDVSPKICPYSFVDLFAPLKSDGTTVRPQLPYYPFDYMPRQYTRVGQGTLNTCQVRLDQWNFDSFYLLKDKALFDRLNKDCDIIYLKSNQYYNSFLMDESVHGPNARELNFQFSNPFHDISKIIFVPHYTINIGTTVFIEKKFKGLKWLSFYAKGFVEGSKDTTDAFACINKLLNTGEIGYVFFTAETSRHIDLAYNLIEQTSKVVTIERDMQNIVSKDPRRRDVDISMIQWVMIGRAHYCMANSVRSTIFAMTAFVAGNCKYVPLSSIAESNDGSCCNTNRTIESKEMLFSENPRLKSLNFAIDEEKRKKVWTSVIQERKEVENVECFRLSHTKNELGGDLPRVLSYWIESGNPRINETGLSEIVAAEVAAKMLETQKLNTSVVSGNNFTNPFNKSRDATSEDSVKTEGVSINTRISMPITVSPTPRKVIDKMAVDNFQIDNWNPTAVPTVIPTAAPSIPYTFKKLSAVDRMIFKSSVGG